MTDKEPIIVHGVDVSKCDRLNLATAYGWDDPAMCSISCCKNGPNCLFKQLARKTQECKRLGHYVTELIKYLEETANILGLNTNATILGKNAIEYWAVLSSSSNYTIKKLQHKYEGLRKEKEKNDRYRKALDEIEGLVSKVDGADECSYGDFNCSNCDDDCTCPTKVKRLILDIINKVNGEE